MLLILIEICHFRLCKSIYLCIRVKWSNQNGSVLGNIRTKRLFVSKFAFGVMSKFPNYEAFLTCRIWADVAKPLMEYQILNKAFSLDQHPHVICLKLFRNAAQLTLWSRIDYQNIAKKGNWLINNYFHHISIICHWLSVMKYLKIALMLRKCSNWQIGTYVSYYVVIGEENRYFCMLSDSHCMYWQHVW